MGKVTNKKPDSENLIKELSEIDGLAGFERPVAETYKKFLSPELELKSDYMGNIAGALEGTSAYPRIMICAHLDEIGLLVHSITDDGKIKFIIHGAWWDYVMLQSLVNIRTKDGKMITGIVSSLSNFFLKGDKLDKYKGKENMFIDIGAKDKKEVEDLGIRYGDPISFAVPFRKMAGSDMFMGKAFDDRIGLAIIIETIYNLKGKVHPNVILPVATVQEEVGCRGARAATNFVTPDIAIILEGPPSDDVPLKKNNGSQCVLGNGPHLRRLEPGMISNGGLFRFIRDKAEEMDMPYQVAIGASGGTDGMVIHSQNLGIPSIMIGVPVRYAHSHHGLFSMGDYKLTVKLITEVLLKLGPEALEEIRRNPYG